VAASGGSTNSVLHLIALARETGVRLSIDDFDEISRRTPPDHRPHAERKVCAPPISTRRAARMSWRSGWPMAGYLNANAITVTGKSLVEEANDAVEVEGRR